MTSTYFLLTFLLAASYLQYGDCTKCYHCTSLEDPKCADPMTPDDNKAVQCTPDILKQGADIFNAANKKLSDWSSSIGINVQSKPIDAQLQCSKVDVSEGDKKITIRSCSLPTTQNLDPCKKLTEQHTSDKAKVTFCQICNSDYCNGAQTLGWSTALLFPLMAVLFTNYY